MPPPPAPFASPSIPPRRRRLPLAALGLVALLLAFGGGVIHLIRLRFEIGDVYPPYSTLRGDPLGAKVFFDSLQKMPGLVTARSFRPLALLGVPPLTRPSADHGESQCACFYLGADPEEWPFLLAADSVERIEQIAARGGRIILTFQPSTHPPTNASLEHRRGTRTGADAKKSPAAPRPSVAPSEPDLTSIWGIDFRRGATDRPLPPTAAGAIPVAAADSAPVAAAVPVAWPSALDFQLDTAAARRAGWHVLYQRAGHPVIVARPYGHAGGELILCSDTYFLSNEGLHGAAHPDLLAGLIGPTRTVLFDESHFGIGEHPGLMTLARRYRLQGALAVLALLAALFVWRNAVSLLPPRTGAGALAREEAPVLGRNDATGFLNLLRRGVAARDLPALCVTQWRQRLAPTARGAAMTEVRQRATPENIARLERVLAGSKASPAALYREMCVRLRANEP